MKRLLIGIAMVMASASTFAYENSQDSKLAINAANICAFNASYNACVDVYKADVLVAYAAGRYSAFCEVIKEGPNKDKCETEIANSYVYSTIKAWQTDYRVEKQIELEVEGLQKQNKVVKP